MDITNNINIRNLPIYFIISHTNIEVDLLDNEKGLIFDQSSFFELPENKYLFNPTPISGWGWMISIGSYQEFLETGCKSKKSNLIKNHIFNKNYNQIVNKLFGSKINENDKRFNILKMDFEGITENNYGDFRCSRQYCSHLKCQKIDGIKPNLEERQLICPKIVSFDDNYLASLYFSKSLNKPANRIHQFYGKPLSASGLGIVKIYPDERDFDIKNTVFEILNDFKYRFNNATPDKRNKWLEKNIKYKKKYDECIINNVEEDGIICEINNNLGSNNRSSLYFLTNKKKDDRYVIDENDKNIVKMLYFNCLNRNRNTADLYLRDLINTGSQGIYVDMGCGLLDIKMNGIHKKPGFIYDKLHTDLYDILTRDLNDNTHILKFDDYDYAIKYSLSGWHDIKGEWQIFVDSKECDNILGCWRIDDDKDNEVSGENGTAPWWHRRSTFNPLGKKIDDGCIAYSYGKIGISEDMFSTNDFDLLVRAITRSIEGLYTNNLKRLWEDMGKKGRIIVEGLVMLTTDEDFPYIESVTIGSL